MHFEIDLTTNQKMELHFNYMELHFEIDLTPNQILNSKTRIVENDKNKKGIIWKYFQNDV